MTTKQAADIIRMLLGYLKGEIEPPKQETIEEARAFEQQGYECLEMAIKALEQQEKTAEWYEEDGCEGACEGCMGEGVICSQCGALLCGYIGDYDFCPNCGARMVSE